ITNRERAAPPRHDQKIVVTREDHGESKRAFETAPCRMDRLHGIAAGVQFARDKMSDNLCVGVARELRACRSKLLLQGAKSLDYAVMPHRRLFPPMRER